MVLNIQDINSDMRSEENNFVILSRRLREGGDFDHAERLLKNGLKRVESNLQNDEMALLEILKELVSIYQEQGRLEEHCVLKDRIDEISDPDVLRRYLRPKK